MALKAELGEALPRTQLRQLHHKSAWRHGIVAARQFGILAVATWGLIRFDQPLIWIKRAAAAAFILIGALMLLGKF